MSWDGADMSALVGVLGWERVGGESADVSAQSGEGGIEECGGMTPLFWGRWGGGVGWDGADMSALVGVLGWERLGEKSADVSAQYGGKGERSAGA
ncbi:hypothetical protein HNR46_000480 [Haloferula luteola]|uniref:Uncharacterized protein n=1 Tax=Haloferula luteola TaxID=595692 RepID=A0A840UZJ9_9BACT|nr:hypothetical protein [Haloferula luteola]MBB5350256.1 hypothetical protein [Haloferula luteola]